MVMEKLASIFWTAVAGIVICLGGGIYTAIHNRPVKVNKPRAVIPIPALPSAAGAPAPSVR